MKAKHIVFATTGSLGDLHPFLALGCELKKRGHQVSIATTQIYMANINVAGLNFHHMRPDPIPSAQFHAAFMHPVNGGQFVYKDYLAPAIELSYEDLLVATQNADLLISQSLMALAAPLVAKKTGIRWISAVFQPMSFFSVHDRPSYLPSNNLPSHLLQWLCAISPKIHSSVLHYVKIYTRNWVLPVITLQQKLNLDLPINTLQNINDYNKLESNKIIKTGQDNHSDLPFCFESTGFNGVVTAVKKPEPLTLNHAKKLSSTIKTNLQTSQVSQLTSFTDEPHPMFDAQHAPRCVLAMFSPLLGGTKPDWPAQVKQTGQALYSVELNTLSEDLRTFLQMQAPLVFTLSSAASNNAGDFYSECFKAAKALKLPALLMTGGLSVNADLPEPLPEWARRVDYADFSLTFPYATAIVHAGGIATSFHALCAGKLQVLVPHAHDQTDNALRLQKLGVARVIPKSKFNSRNLQQALQALINDAPMVQRAKNLAIKANAENGVIAACDVIESVLSDA